MAKDRESWMVFKRPIWLVLAFFLVAPIKWLFDNLGYAILIDWLADEYGIQESDVIALVSANFIPIVLTIVLVYLIYRLSLLLVQPVAETSDGPTESYIEESLSGLTPESLTLLRKMLVAVRPAHLFDPGWPPLEAAGLVERNVIGAKGIKPELRSHVEKLLGGVEAQTQRYASAKWATEHIQKALGLSRLDGWSHLRDAAGLGEVTIFGRPENSTYKPPIAIPADHWVDYGFDYTKCQFLDSSECTSEPDDPKKNFKGYCYRDLRVIRAQVEDHWRLPPSRTALENPSVLYFVTGNTFTFSYSTPQVAETRVPASISFTFPEMKIIDAANVSALVDHGGDNLFSVLFVDEIGADYFASVKADKTCGWSVEQRSPSMCVLKLQSPTENRFKILFERA